MRGQGDNLSTPASSDPVHPARFGSVSNVAARLVLSAAAEGGRTRGCRAGASLHPETGAGGAAGEPRGDPPWGRRGLRY